MFRALPVYILFPFVLFTSAVRAEHGGDVAPAAPNAQETATAGKDQTWPNLEAGLLSRWEQLVGARSPSSLKQLTDVEDLKAFLTLAPLKVIAVPPFGGIQTSQLARYQDRSVYLNKKYIAEAYAILKGRGLSEEKILDILALKLFPTFAHEVQHGITERETVKKFGADVLPFLENELISFARQIRALESVRNLREMLPDLRTIDDNDNIAAVTWEMDGLPGLRRQIAKVYGTLPDLQAGSRDGLLKYLSERIEKDSTYVEMMESFEKRTKSADERERQDATEAMKQHEPLLASARISLKSYEATRKLLDDPKKLGELQGYARQLLQDVSEPLHAKMYKTVLETLRLADSMEKMGKYVQARQLLDFGLRQRESLPEELRKRVDSERVKP